MKEPAIARSPKPSRTTYSAGTYLACLSCGRLLKIEWAVRSLVCSCGARIKVTPPDPDGK